MAINEWAKLVTGWKSVNIYESVIVERAGRTLDERLLYLTNIVVQKCICSLTVS